MDRLPVEIFLQILRCVPLTERVKHKLVARSWDSAIAAIPIHLSPAIVMNVVIERSECCRINCVRPLSDDPFTLDSLCKGADLYLELIVECPGVNSNRLKWLISGYFKTENIIFDQWFVVPSEQGVAYEHLVDELKAGLILTHGKDVHAYLGIEEHHDHPVIVVEEMDLVNSIHAIDYDHSSTVYPSTSKHRQILSNLKYVSVDQLRADLIERWFWNLCQTSELPNIQTLSLTTCNLFNEDLMMLRPFVESIVVLKSLKNLRIRAFSCRAVWEGNHAPASGESRTKLSNIDHRSIIMTHIMSCLDLETLTITEVKDLDLAVYLNEHVLNAAKPSFKILRITFFVGMSAGFGKTLLDAVRPLIKFTKNRRRLIFEFRRMKRYQKYIEVIDKKMDSVEYTIKEPPLKIAIARKGHY